MNIMMRITHILPALALLTALLACSKTTVYPEPQEPGTIFLSATESGTTKAMFTGQTFGAAGNTLQIYDFVTGCTDNKGPYDPYINSLVLSDGNGGWPFIEANGTEKTYEWTQTGIHKFFGWLDTDANLTYGSGASKTSKTASEFFGPGFGFGYNKDTAPDNRTLTIPSKAMTQSTEQFDFMYSDIVTRNVKANDFDPATAVNLNFNHLFTAFGIEVKNASEYPVTIHEFKIEGLPNRKSAVINYGIEGTEPEVTYTPLAKVDSNEGDFIANLGAGYTITPGQQGSSTIIKDIFNPNPLATEPSLFLMWPMISEEVHSEEEPSVNNDVLEYPESWKMYIRYSTQSATVESRMNFPEGDWLAGKQYLFTLTFADKLLSLGCAIRPWDYIEQDVNLTDVVTVAQNGTLKWSNCVLVDETKSAMVADGKPVIGKFTLATPQGAVWLASLVGDINAFDLSPRSGVINGEEATITLTPKINNPGRDYKVKVKFAIRLADGTIIPTQVVDPVGDTQYTVVLGKSNI